MSTLRDLLLPQWQIARAKKFAELEATLLASQPMTLLQRESVNSMDSKHQPGIASSGLKQTDAKTDRFSVITRNFLNVLQNNVTMNCVLQYLLLKEILDLSYCGKAIYQTIKTSSYTAHLSIFEYLRLVANKKPSIGIASGCKICIGGTF